MPTSNNSLISAANAPDLGTINVLPFIADSVICTDESGRILLFNPAAERSFGYSAAEVVGKDIGILLPARYRADHRGQVQTFGLGLSESSRLMGHEREVWGLRKNGEEFAAEATISRHSLNGRNILTVVHRDITERRELEEQREAVARELDHRIKNVISVVSALVSLTAKGAETVADFAESLQARLRALGATQSLLARSKGAAADLETVLSVELAQYRAANGTNLRIEGANVPLRAASVQPLALAIHELATNSAKYGAFSEASGQVTIVTDTASASGARQLVIEWQEKGGPTTLPPDRQGFGTLLIREMVERALKGSVHFDYRPEGLVCRMVMPGAGLEESELQVSASP